MATSQINDIVINKNLEAPPFRIPLYDAPGVMNSTWVRWLQGIFDRVGGNSGNLIYDNANSAQQTSSLEPQLFAIKAEIENQLTGIVLQIIEQVQEQSFDVSGLVADISIPPVEIEPFDASSAITASILQQAFDNSPVKAPFYEEYVATAGQTVINTVMLTTSKSGGKAYNQVFLNGVLQMEGASKNYTVTGLKQITFTSALALNDDVAIFGYV